MLRVRTCQQWNTEITVCMTPHIFLLVWFRIAHLWCDFHRTPFSVWHEWQHTPSSIAPTASSESAHRQRVVLEYHSVIQYISEACVWLCSCVCAYRRLIWRPGEEKPLKAMLVLCVQTEQDVAWLQRVQQRQNTWVVVPVPALRGLSVWPQHQLLYTHTHRQLISVSLRMVWYDEFFITFCTHCIF